MLQRYFAYNQCCTLWLVSFECCWIDLVCLPVISTSRMLFVMPTHYMRYVCRVPIVRMLPISGSLTFPFIIHIRLYVCRFSQLQRCFFQYACREPIVRMLPIACQAPGVCLRVISISMDVDWYMFVETTMGMLLAVMILPCPPSE